MILMVNFLIHAQTVETKPASKPCINNEIFNQFCKSYTGLKKMCSVFDVSEGTWMAMLVDFFTRQLIDYAEEADYEIHSNPFQAKQAGIDLSNMSENQKLENA